MGEASELPADIRRAYNDERPAIFARFISTELGLRGRGSGRVLDVAGGKGHLSAALIDLGHWCMLVDPCAGSGRDVVRDGIFPGASPSRSSDEHVLSENSSSQPLLIVRQTMLGLLASPDGAAALSHCDALVGLHPDEATEEIVDTALEHSIPFAVVPCCVFPQLFPERRLPPKVSGRPGVRVRKHGAFVEYIRQKDWRIRSDTLPFGGRNLVLYMTREDYTRPSNRPPPPAAYEPCTQAARRGDLPALRALVEAGSPWNTEVLQAAAWSGHLHVLEFARAHGCAWSDNVYPDGWQTICTAAAQGGHSKIGQWAEKLQADDAIEREAVTCGVSEAVCCEVADPDPETRRGL